jgi:hypothetical protein
MKPKMIENCQKSKLESSGTKEAHDSKDICSLVHSRKYSELSQGLTKLGCLIESFNRSFKKIKLNSFDVFG